MTKHKKLEEILEDGLTGDREMIDIQETARDIIKWVESKLPEHKVNCDCGECVNSHYINYGYNQAITDMLTALRGDKTITKGDKEE